MRTAGIDYDGAGRMAVKLLVLGAGGIGGYFGGRLAEAGADITFLVRPRRCEQLQRDGLRIQSRLGDLQRPVRTVLAEDLRPGYDLVLLTCKAYDLDSAMDAIAPAMDGTCAVVPMLNGIAHFDRLDRRFGSARIMGGTCQIIVTLRPDGVVDHAGVLQRLVFGERDRSSSARAQGLAEAFAKTKIDWQLSDDIEQDVWEKVMFLSALAATTCLFRANVREIIASPGGREVMERALAANIEIATREGHPPRPTVIEFARNGLTNPAGTWSTSMLRDLEGGGCVEADHIVGWMLDKARKHGIDDAILSLAYTHLKAYETRRAAGRLPGG
jgi:2-dehydropantoate 2-reductase